MFVYVFGANTYSRYFSLQSLTYLLEREVGMQASVHQAKLSKLERN